MLEDIATKGGQTYTFSRVISRENERLEIHIKNIQIERKHMMVISQEAERKKGTLTKI